MRYSSQRHFAAAARTSIVATISDDRVENDPLADFLTARWALFTSVAGRTLRLRNTHEPWELYRATLVSLNDSLLATAGFPHLTDRAPDSVLYSPGVVTRFGRGV